jgi:hypothetical protein
MMTLISQEIAGKLQDLHSDLPQSERLPISMMLELDAASGIGWFMWSMRCLRQRASIRPVPSLVRKDAAGKIMAVERPSRELSHIVILSGIFAARVIIKIC